MTHQEEQPKNMEELNAELNEVNTFIESKRGGRAEMVRQGLVVEPEASDQDMIDLLARKQEIEGELAQFADADAAQGDLPLYRKID